MGLNVTRKLIASHLVAGEMVPGQEIAIRIDQTLTQDATGTLVMLELEAMRLDRVKTEVSVQYVDHNLVQSDHKNPDDHLFLLSAARRFGLWYSRAGNGVSHPMHMQHFGKPGKTLLGADSHTPAAGSLGMLAIGAGGIDVATAMAGEPFYFRMPAVWGVRLVGHLPAWVSAKDVILEMLRRHGVKGGVGRAIEYHGPGLAQLSAMDRHVLANMGAELGATTTVFPSDEEVRHFLRRYQREADWVEVRADEDATYDYTEEIDLSTLEPLIALPSSPGNVVPVREVAGQGLYQAYIGSSANPGYRDFAISALMVQGRQLPAHVSFDINPTSRGTLETLLREGMIDHLIHAGARLHQAGCNGCIGMGQAPASGRNSLRTVPRNFPSRSGTIEDAVFLCSPETATASALMGVITDPRDLAMPYPQVELPEEPVINRKMLVPPLTADEARGVELVKGPNIFALPDLDALPHELTIPILLKVGDDISTDEILPAGSRVLPYRSNIPKISEFTFDVIDPTYAKRAALQRQKGGHAIIGGSNYGQGSSREHAALAPRYLGLRVVIAKSFARIHRKNLINYGVLPLVFADPKLHGMLEPGDVLQIAAIHAGLLGATLPVYIKGKVFSFEVTHSLSSRDIEVLLAGGITNWLHQRKSQKKGKSRI
jgi:aconitate hydratase